MRLLFTRCFQCVLLVLAPLSHHDSARCQQLANPASAPTYVRATPCIAFQSGTLRKAIIGPLWRDAWVTEIQAEGFDLLREREGLKLERRTGDSASFRLRLKGTDGARYMFRTLQRSPGNIFPSEVLNGFTPAVLNELVAGTYPFADLVTRGLASAIDVPCPDVRMVALTRADASIALPADGSARLGMFFQEFSAQPTETLLNTRSVEKLVASNGLETIDAPEVLKVRLFDFILGSWNEGSATWRWSPVQRGEMRLWKPVVSSHPLAFSRFGGAIALASGFVIAPLPDWNAQYPDVNVLAWSGRSFDERVLSGLSWRTFDSLASFICRHLSDSVINEAVGRIPAERRMQDSGLLRGILQERRNNLPAFVKEYYASLAKTVDVYVPNGAQRVELLRPDVEHLAINVLISVNIDSAFCIFYRVFDAQETDEVRIHAGDATSRILCTGLPDNKVSVIVVEGPDSQGLEMEHGDGDDRGGLFEDGILVALPKEFENRGSSWNLGVMADFNTEAGLLLGVGPVYTRYGFRMLPYSWTFSALVGYAPFTNNGRARVYLDTRSLIRGASVTISAFASGYEMSGFFGVGNETEKGEGVGGGYYHPHVYQYRAASSLSLPVASSLRVAVTGSANYLRTEPAADRYVNFVRPYGIDGLAYFGVGGAVEYDSRDEPANPQQGVLVRISGSTFPRSNGLTGSFGKSHYEVRAFAGGTGSPAVTVAFRGLGERAWGDVPYYELPNLGGWTALRGFASGRYMGNALAVGTLELRTSLGHLNIIVPSTFGVNCFAEAGRVYVEGENSGRWHASFGGTVWVAPWSRENTMSMIVAGSKEGIEMYFDLGVGF
jgi:hypothetical protein